MNSVAVLSELCGLRFGAVAINRDTTQFVIASREKVKAKMSFARATILCALGLTLLACKPKPQASSLQAEAGSPDEGSVVFDITPENADAGAQQWLATYKADGKTAKFHIVFGLSKVSSGITFGDGRFIAEPGSDASAFLLQLKKALEAKNLPAHVERVHELPFQLATIGHKLSRSPGGGFDAQPAGDWTATKIFLANDEAEVFLNINPVLGKAEFSIKDPDYGDQVLAELAKIL